MKIIAQNKKAYHDYDILDKIEAGIVLKGDEVKSLRAGMANLTGSFATLHDGELYLINAHITPYDKAYRKDEDADFTYLLGLVIFFIVLIIGFLPPPDGDSIILGNIRQMIKAKTAPRVLVLEELRSFVKEK